MCVSSEKRKNRTRVGMIAECLQRAHATRGCFSIHLSVAKRIGDCIRVGSRISSFVIAASVFKQTSWRTVALEYFENKKFKFENAKHRSVDRSDGWTVSIAAPGRFTHGVYVRSQTAATQSHHIHTAAIARIGDALPEDALSGRISARRSRPSHFVERGARAGTVGIISPIHMQQSSIFFPFRIRSGSRIVGPNGESRLDFSSSRTHGGCAVSD